MSRKIHHVHVAVLICHGALYSIYGHVNIKIHCYLATVAIATLQCLKFIFSSRVSSTVYKWAIENGPRIRLEIELRSERRAQLIILCTFKDRL